MLQIRTPTMSSQTMFQEDTTHKQTLKITNLAIICQRPWECMILQLWVRDKGDGKGEAIGTDALNSKGWGKGMVGCDSLLCRW
jgi:hypothetical protein